MPDRVISVPQATQIATRIKNKFDNVNGRLTAQETSIGDLSELETEEKDDIVGAINELNGKVGGNTAEDTSYDNTASGLTGSNVQDALDEVVLLIGGVDTLIGTGVV